MAKYKASRYNHVIPIGDGRELTFNALSRSLEVLDAGEAAFLRELSLGDEHDSEDPRIERFSKARYVLRQEVDERSVVRVMYASQRFPNSRMTLTIMPTAVCNFACDYCFQGAEKPSEWMTKDVQAQLLAFIERRAPELRHFNIAWYGGEPLLAMQVIRDVSVQAADLAKRHGLSFGSMVVTNGYRLTRAIADELHSLGVREIQVTLDGPCEIHDQKRPLLGGQGTYERIVENLAEAVEQTGIRYSVRINVDRRNAPFINGLLDDLAARGLSNRRNLSIYTAPVETATEGCHSVSSEVMQKVDYSKVEVGMMKRARQLKIVASADPPLFASQCAAIRPMAFVVCPNGDLHKCWNTVNEPQKKVGSLFDEARLEEPDPTNDLWMSWTPLQDPICRDCTTLPLCGGYCAYHFIYENDIKTPDSRPCPSWKYNLPEKLLLLAKDRKLLPESLVVDLPPPAVPAAASASP